MQPLIYLTLKSFFNGVKRALSSPRRILGTLFFFGYYFFIFFRPFERPSKTPVPVMPANLKAVTLPSPASIEPYVLASFVGVSMMLSLGILSYKATFRPADVDVLFPTPVNPKVVLMFRMVRDYFLTLIMPLFLLLVGFKGTSVGMETFFRNFPTYGNYILKAVSFSWILLSMTWTCLGYAASLFMNRSDMDSPRNRRIILGLAWAPMILVLAVVSFALRQDLSLAQFESTISQPWIKVLYFPATFATEIVMAPISDNLMLAVAGVLGLTGMIALSLRIALGQAGWMYDQAAARGFDNIKIREHQKAGDTAGVYAEMARQGKVKRGRISKAFGRFVMRGPTALIWKEGIQQLRTGIWAQVFIGLMMLFMLGMISFGLRGRASVALEGIFVGMTGFLVLIGALGTGQVGFAETLRKGDVLKPLPFKASQVVMFEVLAKGLPALLPLLVTALFAPFLSLRLWDEALGCLILMPTFVFMLTAISLLVTVLFPDIEDPTQRGFRSMVSLLALAVSASPGAAIMVALMVNKLNLLFAIPIVVPINLGILWLASALAGNLYASYNPSE